MFYYTMTLVDRHLWIPVPWLTHREHDEGRERGGDVPAHVQDAGAERAHAGGQQLGAPLDHGVVRHVDEEPRHYRQHRHRDSWTSTWGK